MLNNNIIKYINEHYAILNKPYNYHQKALFEGDLGFLEWLKLHFNLQGLDYSVLDKNISGLFILYFNKQPNYNINIIKSYYFLSTIKSIKTTLSQCIDSIFITINYLYQYHNYFCYEIISNTENIENLKKFIYHNNLNILGDNKIKSSLYSIFCIDCFKIKIDNFEIEKEKPLFLQNIAFLNKYPNLIPILENKTFLQNICNAWRIIHRNELLIKEYKNIDFAVDIYDKYLLFWLYNENITSQQINFYEQLGTFLINYFNLNGAVFKTISKNPHNNKLINEIKLFKNVITENFYVYEHNIKYVINLIQGQHIGLFPDQRDSRQIILKNSNHKKIANLFAYTCSFSVASSLGHAEIVFSIDNNKKFLLHGIENYHLNNIHHNNEINPNAKFITDDVRLWINRQIKKLNSDIEYKKFDIIIVDPPTYSSTKKSGNFAVYEEWDFLAQNLAKIINDNGFILFSTNHKKEKSDFYKQILYQYFTCVIERSAPIDYPIINNEIHVKMYICSHQKTLFTDLI